MQALFHFTLCWILTNSIWLMATKEDRPDWWLILIGICITILAAQLKVLFTKALNTEI